MSGSGLPPEAFAAALAELPAMWPPTMATVLEGRSPERAWAAIVAGELRPPDRRVGAKPSPPWKPVAERVDVDAVWQRYLTAGVGVHVLGAAGYPAALVSDRAAPTVLFSRGELSALDLPRVAVIGTRHCTAQGRDLARELGAGLAAAGVSVVSGLALGIDGAAHEGALAVPDGAPPTGVVGSGLDVVYPTRHARLWELVARRGLLLSEAPLGARPEPWRFPARNRILAAIAGVVVVVESREAGGSMITVDEAMDRNVTVLAVPGSVRSAASAGCNKLLTEGALLARDLDDVLVALNLSSERTGPAPTRKKRAARVQRMRATALPLPPVTPEERVVLEAVGPVPASTNDVLRRTALARPRVVVLLNRLEMAGWLRSDNGWWEATPRGLAAADAVGTAGFGEAAPEGSEVRP